MKKNLLSGIFIWIVTLVLAAVSFGQGTTSRMQGNVTDATGAAVAGATVSLISVGTGSTIKTQSSSSGTFAFDLIPPGN